MKPLRGEVAFSEHPMSDFIIETNRLNKLYGDQQALVDVDLRVPPGTIGLLGPNGAGKTTLIKCLLNLEPPTSGSATVLGHSTASQDRASREKVGYSPEQDCHIRGMAGCEYVTYCGQLSGMSFNKARQRAHEILDVVGMGQERYRSMDTYSTGMKQRAKLAQALVHDPKLIILDEPTNGLDPTGREQILQLIGSVWREYGISVMVSSHLLHDVERICDSVIIIANGRILEHETIQTLKSRLRSRFEIVPSGDAERFFFVLSSTGHEVERLSNGRLRVESETASIRWLLSLMRENDLPPAEIVSSSNALHDLFVQSLNSAGNGHSV